VDFPGVVKTNITINSGLETKGKESLKAGAIRVLYASDATGQTLIGTMKKEFPILLGKDSKFMDFLYLSNPLTAFNRNRKR